MILVFKTKSRRVLVQGLKAPSGLHATSRIRGEGMHALRKGCPSYEVQSLVRPCGLSAAFANTCLIHSAMSLSRFQITTSNQAISSRMDPRFSLQ